MFCIAPVNAQNVSTKMTMETCCDGKEGIPTVPVYPWEGDKPLDVGGKLFCDKPK